jgi:hypothetical protein
MAQMRSLLPLVEVPHFHQSGPHDLYALTHDLGDGVQRIVKQKQLTFEAKSNAPATIAELVSAATSRLVVFSEFSENTVYGDPAMNRAQRAWHDGIHLRLGAGFDPVSELRVARQQAHEMALITGDRLAEWVYADLYASILHMVKYGVFPDHQLSLVLFVITTGQIARF